MFAKYTSAIFTVALSGMSAQGLAASIDCKKASSYVESLICTDAALLKLDERLNIIYRKNIKSKTHDNNLKDEQLRWLEQRNTCHDSVCVKKAYEERIKTLENDESIIAQAGKDLENEIFVITSYSRDGIKRLQPMSEGLTAILSMYALQAGTGCTFADDTYTPHCWLTEQLGIQQCSSEHLNLVRSWFGHRLPYFSGDSKSYYIDIQKERSLEGMCYHQPDTASVQKVWTLLTVRQKKSGEIIVHAEGEYSNIRDGDSGEFKYETTYMIKGHEIEILNK